MERAFRFGDERLLIMLVVVPALVLLFILARRIYQKRLASWGDHPLVHRLMPDVSFPWTIVRLALWTISLGMLVIALARPQYGSKLTEVKRKGIEIMIALDVSNSMMALDIQPNRLENAKMAISRMVDRLENDKIGLIVFAGDAYIQMPMTTDFDAAKLFLNSISTQVVPKQGTSVASAIRLGMRSFTPETEKSRAIVIITDGEDHEEGALEAANEAFQAGIQVHTIGIGSPQGVPIPVTSSGGVTDYRKDMDGNVVITKLNEPLLRDIAGAAGGVYVRATASRTGLNDILDEMNKMEKEELGMKIYSEYDDQFPYYAGFALGLLILDTFVSGRKSRWLKKFQIFNQ